MHQVIFANSSNMKEVKDESVHLALLSSPYPMITMWDEQFSQLNPEIGRLLTEEKGRQAFERMHQELDKTWNELYRVLIDGGIACINIGDATRKIGGLFQQFSNHARILGYCTNQLTFSMLPSIIWRKQSNKPNKFLGSYLPPNAYVTLEHEHILILRKGNLRAFNGKEKERRVKSGYFWEERNNWFSDVWFDLKGIDQSLKNKNTRLRSAAYPFELAYRLINMYSIQGDLVLDPFLGTGTTTLAAMASNRNSIGYEIDHTLYGLIQDRLKNLQSFTQDFIDGRLKRHKDFVKTRELAKKALKYTSEVYGFKVITKQETKIQFPLIKEIKKIDDTTFQILYQI